MSNARLLFESIVKDGYIGMQRMVAEEQEEHLLLDFKNKNRPDVVGVEQSDKGTFCKAVSGFSNASGGVIVWGVDCRKGDNGLDAAQQLRPIKNVRRFENDLTKAIPQSVIPPNTGVDNQVILLPGDNDTGFIVTYVPESDLAPHQSQVDHHYYSRAGDSFFKMEHPMIADMFGRRQKPKLELVHTIAPTSFTTSPMGNTITVQISLGLRNIGRYIATYPALTVRDAADERVVFLRSPSHEQNTWSIESVDVVWNNFDDSYIWTGGANDVIHPRTLRTAMQVQRTFPANELWHARQTEHLFSVDYEIFSEGCQPEDGVLRVTAFEVRQTLQP